MVSFTPDALYLGLPNAPGQLASNLPNARGVQQRRRLDTSTPAIRVKEGEDNNNAVDWTALVVGTKILDSRNQLERRFKELVAEWRQQRDEFSSNPQDWAMSLPYQKIIAIGPQAIPFILHELHRKPDHWFWALSVLTDADPIKPEHRGIIAEMAKDWLSWGAVNGFISTETQKPVSKSNRFQSSKDQRKRH